jgi:type II restriction enzyme
VNLSMTGALAAAYHSGAQRARVVTESWGQSNLYCPNCTSPKLTWLEPGHSASDYSCPKCNFWFQLKSQKSRIGDSITDGAYAAMMNAIKRDELPSFYFMQYELATWRVRNLLLVPHFAFPPSAIIKRPPLSPTARRAGWVGCNFALTRLPADARIPVVTESRISPAAEVREKFRRVKPLKEISITQRGWTLDVLNIVRRLSLTRPAGHPLPSDGRGAFTTADAYAFTRELEKLHPDNRHVKDKIRQQLQVLRDAGLLSHVGRSEWRLP